MAYAGRPGEDIKGNRIMSRKCDKKNENIIWRRLQRHVFLGKGVYNVAPIQ